MRTTVGQLLVNRALPEDMRDYRRTLDKKALKSLLSDLAKRYPDEYRQTSHELSKVGYDAAYTTGGNSFGLKHLLKAKAAKLIQQKLQLELQQVMSDASLDDDARDKKIIATVGKYSGPLQKAVYDESLAEGNPLARQVASGSRGSPMNLSSLRGSDLLYTDHRDRVLPIPVLRSYSEGLTPLEYWAGTYGARKGVIDTKFATQDAGFLSKQLNQIAHRALVTALDSDKESPTLRGFPVDTSDEDSEGSLLSHPAGGYARNTVLTPKILDDLNQKGVKRILVRSPAVGGPPDGGVYSRDAGVREFGRLPVSGENVGMAAAQALSEPLSQAQLSSKHAGGVAGASASSAVSGFDYINQLVQVPKQFKGGAAHADLDGLVQRVEDGPAGGTNIWIENKAHYLGQGFNPLVSRGDKVEAGDVISEGVPNPAIIVKHKGIGEDRRYFVNAFRQAFRDAGIKSNRRNIELLSRGLINHIRLQDEVGDYAPDDVIPYSQLESGWKPRTGYQTLEPKRAVGRYLERPYLHYSIGDKVRPSMLQNFSDFGIKEVDVHEDEPPFQPEMIRGMNNLQHDPDWITRMFGSGQKSSVLDAVHRGGSSNEAGTSFVPGLAHGINFNRIGSLQTPKPATSPQTGPTAIGKLGQAARLLLEKSAETDAQRFARVQAIQQVLGQIDTRNQAWHDAKGNWQLQQKFPEPAGPVSAFFGSINDNYSAVNPMYGQVSSLLAPEDLLGPMGFAVTGGDRQLISGDVSDEYGESLGPGFRNWLFQQGYRQHPELSDYQYRGMEGLDMGPLQIPGDSLPETPRGSDIQQALQQQYPGEYDEAYQAWQQQQPTYPTYPAPPAQRPAPNTPPPAPPAQRPAPPTQAAIQPLAPDPRLLSRQFQQPNNHAGTVSRMLQAGFATNPGGMRQAVGAAGPFGAGLLGMTVAPQHTMTLLRGPNPGQAPSSPPKMPELPKLQQPATPQTPESGAGKPIKVPGMRSTTVTPS